MTRISLVVLFALALVTVLPSASSAADNRLSNGQTVMQTAFSAAEKRLITEWFRTHEVKDTEQVVSTYTSDDDGGKKGKGRHGKHGKGGKGLPPGIAMNLARGKPLPPGIAKKQLPNGLVSQLPPAPTGYKRMIVGADVLLVEAATNVIVDVISGALKG